MRFTLERDGWYAMELIGPEFGEDVRTYSPIRIHRIETQGDGSRTFLMDFFHASYPTGVQDKSYLVETIDRRRDYSLGRVLDTDRIILLFGLSETWLNSHFDADIGPEESLAGWCERNT